MEQSKEAKQIALMGQSFAKLYQSQQLSDFIIFCGPHTFKVHKESPSDFTIKCDSRKFQVHSLPIMEIRPAAETDVPSMTAIYNHYVNTTLISLAEQETTPATYLTTLQEVQAQSLPFLVAIDEASNTLAGFAYASPFNTRTGYKFTVEDSIYLSPSYTGRGLGKQLLLAICKALVEDTQAKNVIAKISLEPGRDLYTLPSCRVHMGIGFEEVGRLKEVGFKLGQCTDVVLMQLRLDQLRE